MEGFQDRDALQIRASRRRVQRTTAAMETSTVLTAAQSVARREAAPAVAKTGFRVPIVMSALPVAEWWWRAAVQLLIHVQLALMAR